MSSIVDNYQRLMEALVDGSADLSVATPFSAMFTRQTPQIDFGADQVTIEVFKGNRKVTPLVSRRHPGRDVDNPIIRPGEVGANDYLYALMSPELELNAGTLNKRIPGESPFITGNPDDIKMMRRQWWLNKMSIDAARRNLITDETLAIQSFFDSEMNIGDTYQGESKLVFPRSPLLKNRTVAVSWATAASATPWTDYGNAQREIKKQSQVDGRNTWVSFLPSAAMENLKAIYRSQRSGDAGPNVEFNDFRFNPEQEVPQGFEFLVENGMEYNGWIRSDYSNSRIQLFTLPEGYDSTIDDSAETYTDFLSGNTVSLALYNPSYFKMYAGPGVKEPPQVNVYQNNLPAMGMPEIVNPDALTLGMSGIPARSMILNLYPLGKNEGIGGCLEHAPIFAPIRPDVVATIATTTAA